MILMTHVHLTFSPLMPSTLVSQTTSLDFKSLQNSSSTMLTSPLKSIILSKTFLFLKIYSSTTAFFLPNQRTSPLWTSFPLLPSRDSLYGTSGTNLTIPHTAFAMLFVSPLSQLSASYISTGHTNLHLISII